MENFASSVHNFPSIIVSWFHQLSDNERDGLECPISFEEVKMIVWQCGSDKPSGPDTFTFQFIKTFWLLFESDTNRSF